MNSAELYVILYYRFFQLCMYVWVLKVSFPRLLETCRKISMELSMVASVFWKPGFEWFFCGFKSWIFIKRGLSKNDCFKNKQKFLNNLFLITPEKTAFHFLVCVFLNILFWWTAAQASMFGLWIWVFLKNILSTLPRLGF